MKPNNEPVPAVFETVRYEVRQDLVCTAVLYYGQNPIHFTLSGLEGLLNHANMDAKDQVFVAECVEILTLLEDAVAHKREQNE